MKDKVWKFCAVSNRRSKYNPSNTSYIHLLSGLHKHKDENVQNQFTKVYKYLCGRDSSVSIATGNGLDGPGIESPSKGINEKVDGDWLTSEQNVEPYCITESKYNNKQKNH
jgi:hypothetical protein